MQEKDCLKKIKKYKAGKPISELERELNIKNSIKLASNENPFGVSKKVIDAIYQNLKTLNRYPDSSAFYLRLALEKKLNINKENIVLGNGSDEIIELITKSYLTQDDEVLLFESSFLMYEILSTANFAKCIFIPLEKKNKDKAPSATLEKLKSKINSKTKIIFLTNPNNPTGTIFSNDEFLKFVKDVPENIIIVIDEAYIDFADKDKVADSLDFFHKNQNIVILRTFSKAYGLAGIRLGFGIMSNKIAETINKIRLPFNVNSIAQVAGIAAIEDEEFYKQSLLKVKEGKKFLFEELDKIKIKYFESQSNFFLIDLKELDANTIYKKMLKKGVIIRSMADYNFPNYIRVSIGEEEENKKFISALKEVLL